MTQPNQTPNPGRHVPFPKNAKIGDKFTRWGYDGKKGIYREITYVLSWAGPRLMWLAEDDEVKE